MSQTKEIKKVGRPTKYKPELVDETLDYIDNTDMPYIEDLALQLHVDEDTIGAWTKQHPRFLGAIKRLKMKQKVSLLKKSLDKEYATAGTIFQLKANHGMVETEKRINEHRGDLVIRPINYGGDSGSE